MKKTYLAMTLAVILSACSPVSTHDTMYPAESVPPPTPEEVATEAALEAERDKAMVEVRRVTTLRAADPALDWVAVGISTGKFSESIGSEVYRTLEECVKSYKGEDTTCFPISALPASYWDAAKPVTESPSDGR